MARVPEFVSSVHSRRKNSSERLPSLGGIAAEPSCDAERSRPRHSVRSGGPSCRTIRNHSGCGSRDRPRRSGTPRSSSARRRCRRSERRAATRADQRRRPCIAGSPPRRPVMKFCTICTVMVSRIGRNAADRDTVIGGEDDPCGSLRIGGWRACQAACQAACSSSRTSAPAGFVSCCSRVSDAAMNSRSGPADANQCSDLV